MTLVNLVHLNLNITHSKWAVLSPGLFAGTFAGLVFIWRCAILVDSLDTHIDSVSSNRWHRVLSSNGLCVQIGVAKLIVEFGLAVPQHCS